MIALYARVSTQEQAKEGYSIDEQVERLKDYCKAMKWKAVKSYVDAGYSGGNTNRPDLQSLISDVKTGKIEKVVVYKLDRLSRSQKDTLDLIEDVFIANNVDFISITENFDTGSPFGRAIIGILSVFAQLEREQLKERMSLGRTGRAKEGKYHGGSTSPIGYDYVEGELIVNDYEAMQVRELFDLYISGRSIRTIGKLFDEKGYTHKYGKWIDSTIRNALLNEIYIGKVKFDKQTYQGTHAPIIDEETFRKAGSIWQTRSKAYQKNRTTDTHSLLGGLLYCKHCGARYSISKTRQYFYYTCYSRRKLCRAMIKNPNCKNKNYPMDVLDAIILNEIKQLAVDPEYISTISSSKPEDKEQLIADRLTKLESQKSRFLDLYGLGEFSVDELQNKVQPINEQISKLVAEKKALSSDKASVDDMKDTINSISDILEKGDHDEIRLVIKSLIERIDIDNDDITITWKFA